MKIVIVAGEVSGDILAAGLIKELKNRYPDAEISGIAGPLMIQQGCTALFDLDELSVMGLVEVLGRLRRILQIRKQLLKTILQDPPDLFIGVDAPDFNLPVEEKVKHAGIKTVHYVSPSVWAWKRKRVFKMKQALDLVMVFMPFEKQFYDQYKVPCCFVGHTLADQIPLETDKVQCRQALSIAIDANYLAILPGSRVGEVKQLTVEFLATVELLRQSHPDLEVLVPLVNQKIANVFNHIKQEHFSDLKLTTFIGRAGDVLGACDVVLLASGTATLEAMLRKRPMVVAYKVNPITYFIGKRLIKTDYISLPNLLANKPLVPELIQDRCEPKLLAAEVSRLLDSDNAELIHAFTDIHKSIARQADKRAAGAVCQLLVNGKYDGEIIDE